MNPKTAGLVVGGLYAWGLFGAVVYAAYQAGQTATALNALVAAQAAATAAAAGTNTATTPATNTATGVQGPPRPGSFADRAAHARRLLGQ